MQAILRASLSNGLVVYMHFQHQVYLNVIVTLKNVELGHNFCIFIRFLMIAFIFLHIKHFFLLFDFLHFAYLYTLQFRLTNHGGEIEI